MDSKAIIEKILADANAEAEKIRAENSSRIASEKSELENQLKQFNEDTANLARKAADDKKAQMLAAARMEIAKQFLAQKRQLLDDVYKKAQEKIAQLPEDKYKKIMMAKMIDAVETGDEEVITDPNDKVIDHNFIMEVNRELGVGLKGNLRLSDQKSPIQAGFILKRGRIRNNVSLAVLLEKARKQLDIELAKDLFSDN